jgi:hypothetical protein
MGCIEAPSLKALRGQCLFYPAAGSDSHEALELFVDHIDEFHFCDTHYSSPGRLPSPFSNPESALRLHALLEHIHNVDDRRRAGLLLRHNDLWRTVDGLARWGMDHAERNAAGLRRRVKLHRHEHKRKTEIAGPKRDGAMTRNSCLVRIWGSMRTSQVKKAGLTASLRS